MKFMHKAAAFATVGAALISAAAAAPAPEEPSRMWIAGGLKRGEPSLSYSTPESDDTGVALRCKRGSGSVRVFLPETNDKLKPGQTVTVTWSVGAIKSSFSAKLMPNEDAGVPSAEGFTPLADPVLAQLKSDGKLTFAIDTWSDSFPLKEIGDEASKFITACSR